jgi:ABC-type Zn uptake system ZnuABC Zn-binding protein ZnuA
MTSRVHPGTGGGRSQSDRRARARGRRRVALIVGAVAGVAGLVDSPVAGAAPRGADAVARSEVASFSCPARATSAGAARSGPLGARRLQVVTTVAPITSIVANVAGDLADVHGVIPEGTDSHTYEPKPSVAELVSNADIVFVNGLKLEDPTKDIAQENLPSKGQIVELGTLTLDPRAYLYDFSFPRDGGEPNPHLWTNPPMAKCYAAIAASVMGKADPANASSYEANEAAFAAKVDQLDQLMQHATATIKAKNRALLTYHDAYAYFAVHYGWEVIGAIQVSSFEDPSPKEVVRLIEQIEGQRVPAIFGSEVFPSPVLAQIAEQTGVKYVDELRDDDLPGSPGAATHSYLGLMKFDFVTMVSNLGGDASKLQGFDPADVARDEADYPQ